MGSKGEIVSNMKENIEKSLSYVRVVEVTFQLNRSLLLLEKEIETFQQIVSPESSADQVVGGIREFQELESKRRSEIEHLTRFYERVEENSKGLSVSMVTSAFIPTRPAFDKKKLQEEKANKEWHMTYLYKKPSPAFSLFINPSMYSSLILQQRNRTA